MRYNPPPNWPKPPEGWAPSAEWTPDPSWPEPPEGWQMWVDDSAAPGKATSKLSRLENASDDSEYFGDDRAWSEDSGRIPARGQNADASDAAPLPTEVAAEDLTGQHVGRRVTVKWDDEHRYDIGTIVAVVSDESTISVKLAGMEGPISFPREASRRSPTSPRLFVWS
jgi:hypothetical protein